MYRQFFDEHRGPIRSVLAAGGGQSEQALMHLLWKASPHLTHLDSRREFLFNYKPQVDSVADFVAQENDAGLVQQYLGVSPVIVHVPDANKQTFYQKELDALYHKRYPSATWANIRSAFAVVMLVFVCFVAIYSIVTRVHVFDR